MIKIDHELKIHAFIKIWKALEHSVQTVKLVTRGPFHQNSMRGSYSKT